MREERIALIREGKPLPPYLMGTSCDSPATSPAHSSFEDSLPNGAQSEGKNGRVDEVQNSLTDNNYFNFYSLQFFKINILIKGI